MDLLQQTRYCNLDPGKYCRTQHEEALWTAKDTEHWPLSTVAWWNERSLLGMNTNFIARFLSTLNSCLVLTWSTSNRHFDMSSTGSSLRTVTLIRILLPGLRVPSDGMNVTHLSVFRSNGIIRHGATRQLGFPSLNKAVRSSLTRTPPTWTYGSNFNWGT